MRVVLLFLIFCCVPFLQAQIPISQARTQPVGTLVTVQGVVTNGSEFGTIRYVQDATGGLAVFPGTGSVAGFSPAVGTDITVTGTVKNYYGLLELDPVSAFTVNSTGNATPTVQQITPALLGESFEGELVRINACTFTNNGGTFSSGTAQFTSNGQPGNIYLRSGHPLIGTTIPIGAVDLVAIVSQYTTNTPANDGYQLLPRTAADMISSTTITIEGPIDQSDIQSTSFLLNWNTNIAGTSQVRFGTTMAMGSNAAGGSNTTTHSVALFSLLPATFYYAQCYSVAGNDTAFSSVHYYSTASEQPGTIAAYFNESVNTSVATMSNATYLGNAMDDTVRAYIDRAQQTLEYAVYNTTTGSIVNGLNDAYDRGVLVRIIAEGSNSNSALSNLNTAIPVLLRQNSQGSGMHNKFIAIDADDANNAYLLTGSTNYTTSSFFYDANNLVIFKDQALSRCYRMEFEEMWGGSEAQPNLANSKFGADKTDNTPHLFNIGGSLVESWFSPSDGTTSHIINALNTTDATVEFALFAFTMNSLANTLVNVEAIPSHTVRGIMETSDVDMGTVQTLQAGGVIVLPDGDPDGYLHHKYAIVDRGSDSSVDPLVITGSHNWSYNAESVNDENTVIIHNAEIADHFYQEWVERFNTAVSIDELARSTLAFNAWPNPTNIELNIRFEGTMNGGSTITIRDAIGRIVRTISNVTTGANSITLNVQDLASGTYIVQVEDAGKRGQQLFVKE